VIIRNSFFSGSSG